ncbi:MAG: hypothetical protein JW863_03450 [Chitinispirillaceae bacterium]|nr:hypothetical protein [Chitinispirillaceae bacterium]
MSFPLRCTLLITGAVLLLGCNQQTISGNGGSSETINARVIIDGTTLTATATDPAALGTLEVFARDYHPYERTGYLISSQIPGGAPSVTVESEGVYNVHITAASGSVSCFLTDLTVRADGSDTIPCPLVGIVRIDGMLVSDSLEPVTGNYAVSVFGSPFFGTTGEGSTFTIDNIPSGDYKVRVRPIAGQLFITTAEYRITANAMQPVTQVWVTLPRQ